MKINYEEENVIFVRKNQASESFGILRFFNKIVWILSTCYYKKKITRLLRKIVILIKNLML